MKIQAIHIMKILEVVQVHRYVHSTSLPVFILGTFLIIFFITLFSRPVDALSRKSIIKYIDKLYDENAYIIFELVGDNHYLILNGDRECIVQTKDNSVIYLNNGKQYIYEDNKLEASNEYENPITLLRGHLKNKRNKLEREEGLCKLVLSRSDIQDINEYSSILNDPTITSLTYEIENSDETYSIRLYAQDSNGGKQQIWLFRGYQSLFNWKLNRKWYFVNEEETEELLAGELEQIRGNILQMYNKTGDDEVDWNVLGEEYISLSEQEKSLSIDKALLYLQNYNLGFVGDKKELLSDIDLFYKDTQNLKYSLYTSLQYVCALKDWLITGVTYKEEVISLD